MATRRQQSLKYLRDRGMSYVEANTFASKYSYKNIRELPYFRRMLRARQLYVNNLKSRGMSETKIHEYIKALYIRYKIDSGSVVNDAWRLLKKYRKIAQDKGEYPLKKGSHHGKGVSKGDVEAQRARRKGREQTKQNVDIKRQIEINKIKIKNTTNVKYKNQLLSENRRLRSKLK